MTATTPIVVTPPSLRFPRLALGVHGGPADLRLSNTDTETYEISAHLDPSGDIRSFVLDRSQPQPFHLPRAKSTTIPVSFIPRACKVVCASLLLACRNVASGAEHTIRVPLVGAGEPPERDTVLEVAIPYRGATKAGPHYSVVVSDTALSRAIVTGRPTGDSYTIAVATTHRGTAGVRVAEPFDVPVPAGAFDLVEPSVLEAAMILSFGPSLMCLRKGILNTSGLLTKELASALREVFSTHSKGVHLSSLAQTKLGVNGYLRDSPAPGRVFEFPRKGGMRRFLVVVSNHLVNAFLSARYRERPNLFIGCQAVLARPGERSALLRVVATPSPRMPALRISASFPNLWDARHSSLHNTGCELSPACVGVLQGKVRTFLAL